MTAHDIVRRAGEAFRDVDGSAPPLTLRGGNDVDSYSRPRPYDPVEDAETDTYFERFAYWGLIYLDARSWRHYLPGLIDYTLRKPDDPAMVTEALVRSLRPPDRYPPRLATLTPEQEAVIADFLEQLALGEGWPHVREEAQQALEEWWLPHPRSRPTTDEVAALRAAPLAYRDVMHDVFRLSLPETLAGSGMRRIPEESRRVETWGGYICGDVHTTIAVNVTPIELRPLAESVRARASLFRQPPADLAIAVQGARRAQRLDGPTDGDSPAEPQDLTLVLTDTGPELVMLSIRTWPRPDVRQHTERIVSSFAVRAPDAASS